MTPLYQYAILVFMGFLPSLFWLVLYLRKDDHPEPRGLITKTFFMGLALAPIAVVAQWTLSQIILSFDSSVHIGSYAWFYVGAAFIEEVVKFLAIQFVVIHKPDFDEPVDAMEYMIAAALGFAAIENILVLLQTLPNGGSEAVQIWFYRFAGATFLHALSSAIVGYFFALSWFHQKHSEKLVFVGFVLATIVHFAFNGIVLYSASQPSALLQSSILLVVTSLVISGFFFHLNKKGKAASSAGEFSTSSA